MRRQFRLRSAIRNSAGGALLVGLFLSRVSTAALGPPTFQWQPCPESYCETGWYASPAVSDVDSDGVV